MSTIWDELQAEAAPRAVTLQDKDRTARKPHPCDGCRSGQIKAGERYRYSVWLEDGVMRQTRTCLGFFSHYGEQCASAASKQGVR